MIMELFFIIVNEIKFSLYNISVYMIKHLVVVIWGLEQLFFVTN